MIADLDRTLKNLLEKRLPEDVYKQVTITFAAPDSKFPPSSVALPAIDLFLYDVRENRDLRSNEPIIERFADGTAKQHRPPIRIDCSYSITVWTADGPDMVAGEHGLLGEVLRVLVRAPTIPADLLIGSLANGAALPVITLQPSRLQSVAELWQAAGGRPKAALHFTVTVPVLVHEKPEDARLVTERVLKMNVGTGVTS